MTLHYNKKEMKTRRRQLRSDMTFSEKVMWNILRRNETGERFLRQYSIDNYVIDFYCPRLKLAVEVDGEVHDREEEKKYDKERQEYVEKYGVVFIEFRNEEVTENGNAVYEKIMAKIKELKTLS